VIVRNILRISMIGNILQNRGAMLKAASTKIKAANLIAAAIASNHFYHSHLFTLSFLYHDYTFIIVNCKKKKEEKFFGGNFTNANLAARLA